MSETHSLEVSSPQERHRPYNLRVTDLRDQAWCEQQLEFVLEEGRPTTPAMQAGSKRHEALHEEITEIIRVRPQTREDMWALHLWNAWAGLQLVCTSGLGREIPVFGKLYGEWIVGIIDELHLESDGTLKLIDTKTRKRPSLPRLEQKQTTRYQMAIYKHLFDQMASGDFPIVDWLRDFRLDPHVPVSESLQKELELYGMSSVTLESLLPRVFTLFTEVPLLSSELQVRYEWQEDNRLLGVDTFPYREDWLEHRATFHLQYWRGERRALGIPAREKWKCRYCSFKEKCTLSPQSSWKR